jgi:hypothetical protein
VNDYFHSPVHGARTHIQYAFVRSRDLRLDSFLSLLCQVQKAAVSKDSLNRVPLSREPRRCRRRQIRIQFLLKFCTDSYFTAYESGGGRDSDLPDQVVAGFNIKYVVCIGLAGLRQRLENRVHTTRTQKSINIFLTSINPEIIQ